MTKFDNVYRGESAAKVVLLHAEGGARGAGGGEDGHLGRRLGDGDRHPRRRRGSGALLEDTRAQGEGHGVRGGHPVEWILPYSHG
eukprot:1181504-Prorocentrum_minimum.AAC.1